MFKVAILGCENSHANAFLDLVLNQKLVDDVEFVGVYSDDAEAAAKLTEKFGVYAAKSYDEFVGKIDGLIITARHGDNHHRYAKPYIESGIPMFVDKPITVSEADALEFMRALKANGVKVCGGSSCIHAPYVRELKAKVESGEFGKLLGGDLRAPVSMDNEYGGWFFYSQHLVQVMCEIFGFYPKTVQSYKNGNIYNFVVRYADYDVWASYMEGNYVYSVGASLEKKYIGDTYTLDNCYAEEFMDFHKLLHGGDMPADYREVIAPVSILNAMYHSIISGKEAAVNPIGEI